MNDIMLILGCSLIAVAVSFLLVLTVARILERHFSDSGHLLPATVRAERNISRRKKRVA